ncbi:MAG: glycoside hydrolase family 25 protein [Ilumatobacteraceae bacterium]
MSLYGVDISNYQAGFDMDAYAAGGDVFITLKVSEGARFKDQYMQGWRDKAHSHGLIVGLYHFLRANDTSVEVDNYLSAIGSLKDNEFVMCDWEVDGPTSAQAQAWLERVESATGRRPVLYSGSPFLAARPTGNLTRWPLWIAAYGVNDGQEHPWPRTDRWVPFQNGPGTRPFEGRTVLWQYTSKARVPGWGAGVDRSRFDGTIDDLKALCGYVQPAPPQPTPQPQPTPVPQPQPVPQPPIDNRTYGYREIHRYAKAKLGSKAADPTVSQTYGGSHTPSSLHYRDSSYAGVPDGCAVDYGNVNSSCQAVFDLFVPLAQSGGPIIELIWQHTMWKNGQKSYYAANDHLTHTHVGIAANAHLPETQVPQTFQEEDDMIAWITENGNFTAYLVTGGIRAWISSGDEVTRLKAAGVKEIQGESSWLASLPKGVTR